MKPNIRIQNILSPRSIFGLCLLLILGLGCATSSEDPYGRVRASTIQKHSQLIRISTGSVPPATLKLPDTESVLFWVNDSDQPIGIVVEKVPNDPVDAPASTGFRYDSKRQLVSTLGPLPPGGLATLRLHTSGTFPYQIWIDGQPVGEGTIVVQEERQP